MQATFWPTKSSYWAVRQALLDQTPQIVRTEKITDVRFFDCQIQPVLHHLCSEVF